MKQFFHGLIILLTISTLNAASFEEAEKLAKEGDWNRAISTYETLLRDQGANATIYYNLGLCYQKKGDTGPAILNYERALAISPRAKDVANNLKKLREERSLLIPTTLPDALPSGIALLSRGEWSLLFLLSLILLVSGIAVSSFTIQKKFRIISIVLSTISIGIAAGSGWIIEQRKAEDKLAVVMSNDQSLLLSPFPTAEKILPYPPGSIIRIEQEKEDYVYISDLSNKTKGWLPIKAIQKISTFKG